MLCSNQTCDFWEEAEPDHCKIVIVPGPASCNRFFTGEDETPCQKCGCLGNRSCGKDEKDCPEGCGLDELLECPCCAAKRKYTASDVIPGLAVLRAACAEVENALYVYERACEHGLSRYHYQALAVMEKRAEGLREQYPAAAAYLQAEITENKTR